MGELALAAQIQVETIRCREREGLLSRAPRSEGKFRISGPEHVERLACVRHCRSLDMALDEIRVLLRFKDDPQAACGEVIRLMQSASPAAGTTAGVHVPGAHGARSRQRP